LATYRPAQVAIRLANQATTRAIGTGTALIQTGSTLIKVRHALLVPSVHRTLAVVNQLAKQGTLMFTGSQVWYANRMAPPTEAEVIAKGETVNGVYLFEKPLEASATAAIRSRARSAFNVPRTLLSIYAIFNHANVGRLKHMRNLVPKQISFMYIMFHEMQLVFQSQGNKNASSNTRQEGSCTPADQSRYSLPVPSLPRRQQVLLCNSKRCIWLC
jgi:hypothetical protein